MNVRAVFHRQQRHGALIGFLLIASACSDNQSSINESTLTRSLQIERVFVWSGLGFTGSITVRPDQTAALSVDGGGTDEGSWHILSNQICTTFQRVANGKPHCAVLYLQADGSYKVRSASTGVNIGLMKLKTDYDEEIS